MPAGDNPPLAVDSLDHPDPNTGIIPARSAFTVRHIVIIGNRKTRPEIILREIPFKEGDTYQLQVLVNQFEKARKQLMNTTLFHNVVVALKSFDGYNIDVLVEVKERWYIFPIPYFKPVDRNLNQWIVEQKASLSRVNYGAKLLYNNTTGRNDKLRVYVLNGYTKQLSFNYDRLYIDRQMKWGMNVGFAAGKNKEINYNTINNKQSFFKNTDFVRNFVNVSVEATYRRAIKSRHRVGLAYTMEEVGDTIVKLNPDYFSADVRRVSYPELYYQWTYYDVDYIPYPTKGYAFDLGVSKKGFNSKMNVWQINLRTLGAWPTGKKSFVSVGLNGTLKAPFRQPYYNQKAFGYGTLFLQGYEYYVIDGVAAGFMKATYSRKLFRFNLRIPGFRKFEPQRIPFTFYGKIYGNVGYSHNPQPGDNFLANRMLYSTGFGIDIFTLYDVTFRLEWSFNQLGQNGIFLHRNTIF